jgi:two-component system, chemotaxis family, protein-glutamate methylesterase/glutaminase
MRTVLVVDDSAFIRRIVRDIIDSTSDFRVVGEAADGIEAIEKVHALQPALVTLDIHMPVLDGLQTLGYIMSEAPRPVVMLSALDATSGDHTLRALELGAVDFVRKPERADAIDLPTLRDRLVGALRVAADGNYRGVPMLLPPPAPSGARPAIERAASYVVAIAASTGGPRALAEIVPSLRLPSDVAVVIVQHMPAGFTESLARRLDAISDLAVVEGRDGDELLGGSVYVAPGGLYATVARRPSGACSLVVGDGPLLHGVRPAADPLFASVADCFGRCAMAVVLTGMGRDGAEGAARIRTSGGRVIVQDRATSVVYGMPQAALSRAGADRIAPLAEISSAIVEGLARRALR